MQFDEVAAKEHKNLAQKHGQGADPSTAATPCSAPITLKRDQRARADFSREKIKPGEDCTAFAYPAIQQDYVVGIDGMLIP